MTGPGQPSTPRTAPDGGHGQDAQPAATDDITPLTDAPTAASTASAGPAGTGGGSGRGQPTAQPPGDDWVAGLTEQARSWYQLAQQLAADGRLALAGDLLARASQLDPTSPQLREAAARAQFAAGQYLGAQASFAAMLAVNPADTFALFGLALSETMLADLESALARLSHLVRVRPDVPGFAAARAAVAAVINRDSGDRVRLPTYQHPPRPLEPELAALSLGERPDDPPEAHNAHA